MNHTECLPVFTERAIYRVMYRCSLSVNGQEAIILFTYNRTSCCPSGIDSGRRQSEDTEGGLHILNRAVGAYTLDLPTLGSSPAGLHTNVLRQDQSSGEDSQTCFHLLFRTLFLPVSKTIERLNITPPLSFPTHDHTRQTTPPQHHTHMHKRKRNFYSVMQSERHGEGMVLNRFIEDVGSIDRNEGTQWCSQLLGKGHRVKASQPTLLFWSSEKLKVSNPTPLPYEVHSHTSLRLKKKSLYLVYQHNQTHHLLNLKRYVK